MGSCGTRMRRASGPARADPGEGREQHGLVRRPGGAGHQGGRAAAEARAAARRPATAATRAATLSKRGSPSTRIRSGWHAEAGEPRRVRLGDGARGGHGLVARAGAASGRASGAGRCPGSPWRRRAPPRCRGPRPGWRAPARGPAWRTPAGRARARRAAGRRARGDRRAGSRPRPPRRRRGQRLGGRAEVGVDQLAVGHEAAQLEQHALRLEPFAHRGGVEPDQRPRAVALRAAAQATSRPRGAAALPVALAHLAVHQAEARGPAPRRAGRRRDSPRRWTASGQCRGGADRASIAPAEDGLASRAGARSRIRSRSSCSTCYRGGDPLSTESRVACGC